MADRSLAKLDKINYNTALVSEQMELMRSELKQNLKKLTKATEKLDDSHVERDPGHWRIVKQRTPDQENPLVKSTADQILKKLDII